MKFIVVVAAALFILVNIGDINVAADESADVEIKANLGDLLAEQGGIGSLLGHLSGNVNSNSNEK